jgi:hypothetical protein
MTNPVATRTIGKLRKPGFLLEPLGWVEARLSQAIAAEPSLIERLFNLDHAGMHLMALALAHMSGDVPPDVALILLQGSRKTILNLSVGHRPVGIDRVLRQLPPTVLTPESYRTLPDLLVDPAIAKVLHHTKSITEPMITGLHNLPAALRTPAIVAIVRLEGMTSFVDGLRLLAARAGLPFNRLAKQIGSLDQPNQVTAKIRQVVDGLPLPDTLPPGEIREFRRLDTPAEIRDLAKRWQNCLTDYISNVNHGTSAIYLSAELEAVCFLVRDGRMGWFLLQTKGPRNVAIAPDQLAHIHAAFTGAGIPPSSMIAAIKSVVLTDNWPHPGLALDDDEIFDDIEVYD